jgi:hypothetical protein
VGEDGEEEFDGETAENITSGLMDSVPTLGGDWQGFAA